MAPLGFGSPACKVLKFNRLSGREDFHTITNLAQSSFSERDHRRCRNKAAWCKACRPTALWK